jgi:hypothetical protein
MKKALFSSLVVAIAAVSANAIPITITLSGPVGDQQIGVPFAVSASLSADATIPQIGLIQVDYSNTGAANIDYNSDVATPGSPLTAALALEVNPPNNPIFARITAAIPSTAQIVPGGSGFVNFNGVCTAVGALVIDVLGPNGPDDATGAFITTDDFSVVWDNGAPGSEQILGGTLTVNCVPEPTSLALLALGAIAAIRRRVA